MALQRLMPWLVMMLAVSVLGMGMAVGAARVHVWLVTASAGSFALWAIGIGIVINLPHWRKPSDGRAHVGELAAVFRQNVRLMSAVYAWGALSMQTLYTTSLTGLRWQHGWQYALLMLLFALASFHVAQALGDPDPKYRSPWLAWAVPMTIATAFLSAFALLFLVFSGKLAVRRADWAANIVFLFGAITMMVLAATTLRSHDKLLRRG